MSVILRPAPPGDRRGRTTDQRAVTTTVVVLAAEVRLTLAVLHVLRHFLEDPARQRYGYDLMRATGYPSGKLYPILARLQHAGWLTRTRETIDPAEVGRPARYIYALTSDSSVRSRQVLAENSAQLAPPASASAPAPPRHPGGGRA